MRGVRVIVLCGAVFLLVTGCDQVNSVKEGVTKVVQRFRGKGGDTAKADTTKQVALATDTTHPAMGAPNATKTPAGAATKGAPAGGATKTGTKQTASSTTQQSKTTPSTAMGTKNTAPATKAPATAMKTAPTQSVTSTRPATMQPAPKTMAPATSMTTTQPATTVAAKPAAKSTRGPRQLTEVEQAALDDLGSQYAMEFDLHPGWFRDHPVSYYDFGATPQPIAPGRVIWPIYGFDSRGTPVAIRGQRPIFSSVPGVGGYSGYWRLSYLIVADHVTPNELRDESSADMMVRRRRAFLKPADVVLNLPVVPRGSHLVGDSTPATYGWFQGREIQYFDFGASALAPVPLWTFTTATDANGDPVFLREQSNVVDTLPLRAPFADLWAIEFVRVDSAYKPNTLRSANAVVGMGAKVESAHSWRNCPIVAVDNARIARAASPLRAYADDRSPLPPSPTIVP